MSVPRLRPIIIQKPDRMTICLAGRFINLSAISRVQNIDASYLSRIVNGEKEPSITVARKICACIPGMTIELLMDSIEDRVAAIHEREKNAVDGYKKRVFKEKGQDYSRKRRGKPTLHRMPALRLKDKV